MQDGTTKSAKDSGLSRTLCVRVGVTPLCVLMLGCLPPVGSRVLPAKSSDLPGVWVGQDEHHWGSVYRLELKPNGSGLLGVSASDNKQPLQLYEIARWEVTDGRLSCVLRQIPPARDEAPLEIRGVAYITGICLEVNEQCDPSRWDPGPRMVREDEFHRDLEQKRKRALDVETKMNEYRVRGVGHVQ